MNAWTNAEDHALPAGRAAGLWSFPRLLVLGVALANLVVFGMGLAWLQHSWRQTMDAARNDTRNLSAIYEQYFLGEIRSIDLALQTVADEYEWQLGASRIDEQGLQRLLVKLWGNPARFASLRVADARGIVRYGAGVEPGSGVSIADRDYFIGAQAPQVGLVVGKPVFARISRTWVVPIARRLKRPDGTFAGVVYINVALESFVKAFSLLDIGPRSAMALRDGDLGLIVRHPEPSDMAAAIGSRSVSQELQALIAAGKPAATYLAHSGFDNVERMFSYRKIEPYPLYIFVGLAAEDFLAPWRTEEVPRTLALAISFLLVSTMAAVLLHRSWKRAMAAEANLALSQLELQTIIDTEPDGVSLQAADGALLKMNRAGLSLFGARSFAQVAGKPVAEFVAPEYRTAFAALTQRVFDGQAGSLEFESIGFDGDRRWLSTHAVPLRDPRGNIRALLAVSRDSTERKKSEAQIRQLAYFDALTGLPNRRLLLDRLNHDLSQCKRFRRPLAVMFLDLDRFKQINDTLGHDAGDSLLVELGERLAACVRAGDTVSRTGGDEFVIVLPEIADSAAAKLVAAKIIEAVGQPMPLRGRLLDVTTSVGIAMLPIDGSADAAELMKRADSAMYAAKQAGRNRYCLFGEESIPEATV